MNWNVENEWQNVYKIECEEDWNEFIFVGLLWCENRTIEKHMNALSGWVSQFRDEAQKKIINEPK